MYICQVVIGFNLNLQLKIIFLSTHNNLLLRICYKNVINIVFLYFLSHCHSTSINYLSKKKLLQIRFIQVISIIRKILK